MRWKHSGARFFIFLRVLGVAVFPAATNFAQDFVVRSVRVLSEGGGRVDFDPSGSDRIAFDRKGPDGYYDLYTIRADGTDRVSVTDGKPGVWQRNNGNPCWHPSGKYLVFQSEHPKHFGLRDKWASNPGVGCYSELWASDPFGREFRQLTFHTVKERLFDGRKVSAVLNPRFSHDGNTLVWTERYDRGGKWGKWRIWMADFILDAVPGPTLRDRRIVFTPSGNMGNYVTCTGVTHDNRKLLLAGNLSGRNHDEFGMDLYLYDLATKRLEDLTRDMEEWTEGAAVMPDGKRIIYMSNKGRPLDFDDKHWYWQKRRREYRIMNLDGTGKRQVTHFNTVGCPEYRGRPVIVADCAWSPDGRRLAATIGEDMSTGDKADIHLRVAVVTFR